jgi:hypothetical protein
MSKIVTALTLLLLAGCEGIDAEPAALTQTVVELHEDGTPPSIVVHELPRTADTVSGGTCPALFRYNFPPMKIYDGDGATGNTACFYGTGTIDLSTVPRAGGNTWQFATKAYTPGSWSGSFGGFLFYSGRLHPCSESFAATRMTLYQAGLCAQNATYLTLTSQTSLP